MLSALLLAPAIDAAPSNHFLRGDANGDGAFTLSDIFAILHHLHLGERVLCEDAADVNDDGHLGLIDPVILISAIFHRSGVIPEPFAALGPDPTADTLDCELGFRGTAQRLAIQSEIDFDDVEFGEPPGDCFDDGGVAELEFIRFRRAPDRPIKALSGQNDLRVPVALSTVGGIEGVTLSFDAPDGLLRFQGVEVEPNVFGKEGPEWVHVFAPTNDESRIAITIALSTAPPFRVLPQLQNEVLATLVFGVAEEAPVGSLLRIRFDDVPAESSFPPIRNEISRNGRPTVFRACGATVEVVSQDSVFIRGDANRDWTVDISDPLGILHKLFARGPGGSLGPFACADAADVNDNGVVDISDASALLGFLFNGDRPPESPFPQAGEDSLVPEEPHLPCLDAVDPKG